MSMPPPRTAAASPPDPQDHLQRIPFRPPEDGPIEMHSGLARHYPVLHGNLVCRPGASRSVGLLMAHPASNFLTHFLMRPLAAAGLPVMAMNTRYVQNEASLIMERAVADLGAGMRWMREELGFDAVVLLGFSGGGPLAAFYQEQAEAPSITDTPAGDPADLTAAGLIPADGLALVGAHAGRARVLRDWIDPAVTDEADPGATDPALDLFATGRTAPLDRAWLSEYRRAQRERMRRIDERCLARTAASDGQAPGDEAFVVHRTAADPRFVDLTLDPSDRAAGSMYGPPQPANTSAAGLARHCTARNWLSTWSDRHSRAEAARNLASVTCPLLVAPLMADQAAFPSEARAMFRAATRADRDLVEIPRLTHYMAGQPDGPATVVDVVAAWLRRAGLPCPDVHDIGTGTGTGTETVPVTATAAAHATATATDDYTATATADDTATARRTS